MDPKYIEVMNLLVAFLCLVWFNLPTD